LPERFAQAAEIIRAAYRIAPEKPPVRPLVHKVMNG
jgi:hypothetical protein